MRTRAAARALAAEDARGAAELLADAVALAGEGEATLAAALGEALLHPVPELAYEHLAAVYAEAVAGGHEESGSCSWRRRRGARTRSRAIAPTRGLHTSR